MKAKGHWTWWNQYGNVPLDKCVRRAKKLKDGGVIVKHGYWTAFDAFKRAGVPVAIERYTYPGQPLVEAQKLSEGIVRGAEFAVINAEIEWERAGNSGGRAMKVLIDELQRLTHGVEIYASVNTRVDRTRLPYQKELGKRCTAWMPMIYPKEFFFPPFRPAFHIPAAFTNSLDTDQSFQNKPVLPTFQTYNGIGAHAVNLEINEVAKRDLPGMSAYTICHATDSEWTTFIASQPNTAPPPPPPPTDTEELEEQIRLLELRVALSGKVTQWAGYGFAGEEPPQELLETLHFLLHLAQKDNE